MLDIRLVILVLVELLVFLPNAFAFAFLLAERIILARARELLELLMRMIISPFYLCSLQSFT